MIKLAYILQILGLLGTCSMPWAYCQMADGGARQPKEQLFDVGW